MAKQTKRFNLRFLFPSFHFCRLTQPSSLPVNPKAMEIAYPKVPEPPPPTPNLPLFKCHVSPKILPVNCGSPSGSCSQYNASECNTKSQPEKKLEKQHKPRHKLHKSSVSKFSKGGKLVSRQLKPCTVDGKVKESFAVVKSSEDPHEDFKRSMLEMILEKQMFDAKDMELLLLCFLSLNSPIHHSAIVEAFAETWEFLFCKTPESQRISMGY